LRGGTQPVAEQIQELTYLQLQSIDDSQAPGQLLDEAFGPDPGRTGGTANRHLRPNGPGGERPGGQAERP
jgi:hypothetical protein